MPGSENALVPRSTKQRLVERLNGVTLNTEQTSWVQSVLQYFPLLRTTESFVSSLPSSDRTSTNVWSYTTDEQDYANMYWTLSTYQPDFVVYSQQRNAYSYLTSSNASAALPSNYSSTISNLSAFLLISHSSGANFAQRTSTTTYISEFMRLLTYNMFLEDESTLLSTSPSNPYNLPPTWSSPSFLRNQLTIALLNDYYSGIVRGPGKNARSTSQRWAIGTLNTGASTHTELYETERTNIITTTNLLFQRLAGTLKSFIQNCQSLYNSLTSSEQDLAGTSLSFVTDIDQCDTWTAERPSFSITSGISTPELWVVGDSNTSLYITGGQTWSEYANKSNFQTVTLPNSNDQIFSEPTIDYTIYGKYPYSDKCVALCDLSRKYIHFWSRCFWAALNHTTPSSLETLDLSGSIHGSSDRLQSCTRASDWIHPWTSSANDDMGGSNISDKIQLRQESSRFVYYRNIYMALYSASDSSNTPLSATQSTTSLSDYSAEILLISSTFIDNLNTALSDLRTYRSNTSSILGSYIPTNPISARIFADTSDITKDTPLTDTLFTRLVTLRNRVSFNVADIATAKLEYAQALFNAVYVGNIANYPVSLFTATIQNVIDQRNAAAPTVTAADFDTARTEIANYENIDLTLLTAIQNFKDVYTGAIANTEIYPVVGFSDADATPIQRAITQSILAVNNVTLTTADFNNAKDALQGIKDLLTAQANFNASYDAASGIRNVPFTRFTSATQTILNNRNENVQTSTRSVTDYDSARSEIDAAKLRLTVWSDISGFVGVLNTNGINVASTDASNLITSLDIETNTQNAWVSKDILLKDVKVSTDAGYIDFGTAKSDLENKISALKNAQTAFNNLYTSYNNNTIPDSTFTAANTQSAILQRTSALSVITFTAEDFNTAKDDLQSQIDILTTAINNFNTVYTTAAITDVPIDIFTSDTQFCIANRNAVLANVTRTAALFDAARADVPIKIVGLYTMLYDAHPDAFTASYTISGSVTFESARNSAPSDATIIGQTDVTRQTTATNYATYTLALVRAISTFYNGILSSYDGLKGTWATIVITDTNDTIFSTTGSTYTLSVSGASVQTTNITSDYRGNLTTIRDTFWQVPTTNVAGVYTRLVTAILAYLRIQASTAQTNFRTNTYEKIAALDANYITTEIPETGYGVTDNDATAVSTAFSTSTTNPTTLSDIGTLQTYVTRMNTGTKILTLHAIAVLRGLDTIGAATIHTPNYNAVSAANASQSTINEKCDLYLKDSLAYWPTYITLQIDDAAILGFTQYTNLYTSFTPILPANFTTTNPYFLTLASYFSTDTQQPTATFTALSDAQAAAEGRKYAINGDAYKDLLKAIRLSLRTYVSNFYTSDVPALNESGISRTITLASSGTSVTLPDYADIGTIKNGDLASIGTEADINAGTATSIIEALRSLKTTYDNLYAVLDLLIVNANVLLTKNTIIAFRTAYTQADYYVTNYGANTATLATVFGSSIIYVDSTDAATAALQALPITDTNLLSLTYLRTIYEGYRQQVVSAFMGAFASEFATFVAPQETTYTDTTATVITQKDTANNDITVSSTDILNAFQEIRGIAMGTLTALYTVNLQLVISLIVFTETTQTVLGQQTTLPRTVTVAAINAAIEEINGARALLQAQTDFNAAYFSINHDGIPDSLFSTATQTVIGDREKIYTELMAADRTEQQFKDAMDDVNGRIQDLRDAQGRFRTLYKQTNIQEIPTALFNSATNTAISQHAEDTVLSTITVTATQWDAARLDIAQASVRRYTDLYGQHKDVLPAATAGTYAGYNISAPTGLTPDIADLDTITETYATYTLDLAKALVVAYTGILNSMNTLRGAYPSVEPSSNMHTTSTALTDYNLPADPASLTAVSTILVDGLTSVRETFWKTSAGTNGLYIQFIAAIQAAEVARAVTAIQTLKTTYDRVNTAGITDLTLSGTFDGKAAIDVAVAAIATYLNADETAKETLQNASFETTIPGNIPGIISQFQEATRAIVLRMIDLFAAVDTSNTYADHAAKRQAVANATLPANITVITGIRDEYLSDPNTSAYWNLYVSQQTDNAALAGFSAYMSLFNDFSGLLPATFVTTNTYYKDLTTTYFTKSGNDYVPTAAFTGLTDLSAADVGGVYNVGGEGYVNLLGIAKEELKTYLDGFVSDYSAKQNAILTEGFPTYTTAQQNVAALKEEIDYVETPITAARLKNIYDTYSGYVSILPTLAVPPPASAPEPSLVPTPAPEPSLVPASAPEPSLVPTPAPEPSLVPAPAPEPSLVPTPAPEPSLVPTPAPGVTPAPVPAPEPSLAPVPAPVPTPVIALATPQEQQQALNRIDSLFQKRLAAATLPNISFSRLTAAMTGVNTDAQKVQIQSNALTSPQVAAISANYDSYIAFLVLDVMAYFNTLFQTHFALKDYFQQNVKDIYNSYSLFFQRDLTAVTTTNTATQNLTFIDTYVDYCKTIQAAIVSATQLRDTTASSLADKKTAALTLIQTFADERTLATTTIPTIVWTNTDISGANPTVAKQNVQAAQSAALVDPIASTYTGLLHDLRLSVRSRALATLNAFSATLATHASLRPQMATAFLDAASRTTEDTGALMQATRMSQLTDIYTKYIQLTDQLTTQIKEATSALAKKAVVLLDAFNTLFMDSDTNITEFPEVVAAVGKFTTVLEKIPKASYTEIQAILDEYTRASETLKSFQQVEAEFVKGVINADALRAIQAFNDRVQANITVADTFPPALKQIIASVSADVARIQETALSAEALVALIVKYKGAAEQIQAALDTKVAGEAKIREGAAKSIQAFRDTSATVQGLRDQLPPALQQASDGLTDALAQVSDPKTTSDQLRAITATYSTAFFQLNEQLPSLAPAMKAYEEQKTTALMNIGTFNNLLLQGSALPLRLSKALRDQIFNVPADLQYIHQDLASDADLGTLAAEYTNAAEELKAAIQAAGTLKQSSSTSLDSVITLFVEKYKQVSGSIVGTLGAKDARFVKGLFEHQESARASAKTADAIQAYVRGIQLLSPIPTFSDTVTSYPNADLRDIQNPEFDKLAFLLNQFTNEFGRRSIARAIPNDRLLLTDLQKNADLYLNTYRERDPTNRNYGAQVDVLVRRYQEGLRILRSYPLKSR